MIRLIVGLNNPGKAYKDTRHNAGAWFIEVLAKHYKTSLLTEPKFKSQASSLLYKNQRIFLALPLTFMNASGEAVKLLTDFYRISPEHILIAHDELDLPCGEIRLKYKGGHAGHNGLRDIMRHLQTDHFYRLRIGIGRPATPQPVIDYVLSRPSAEERNKISTNLHKLIGEEDKDSENLLNYLFDGNIEKAFQVLHTQQKT